MTPRPMKHCEHEHYDVIAEEDRRQMCYVRTTKRPIVGQYGRSMRCLACGCLVVSFVGQPMRELNITETAG